MDINKKISVIVPVFKAEKYICKCVNSILKQTYCNLEVILVDDGSPDNSGKICDEYAEMDNRVRVIHQVNSGVAVARNTGLDIAQGDYVTFVDSDDYLDLEMYQAMMDIVEKYECDVVMCDCLKEFIDHSEVYTHDIRGGYYNYEQLRNEYFPHLLMMENVEYPATISNWLCLFKNRRHKDSELYYLPSIRYSEDLLFGAQLMRQADSFYYMKGKNYYHYYCLNPQSATHVYVPDKWDDYKKLHEEIKENFWNDNEFNFKNQVDLCLLFFVYNAIRDTYSAGDLTEQEKCKKITDILKEYEVKEMFKRLNIMNLSIPFKQKIITWCYKYQVGLKFLIKYYR